MSTTYTTNYHLGKQEDTSDNFNMSVITDNMDTIDSALGNKSDKSSTYTKTEVDAALSAKQNTISDLATIRSGAALGATAVQPETGKGLSTNDYTTAEKAKLDGLAEVKSIGTGLNLDSTTGELTATGGGGGGTTVNNATITIQKNGTTVDSFTSNQATDKTINITVPTSAADVSALPDTTKYAAALSLTINSSTYVMTGQLKDQNGDNLGTAQTIDLPLESVVVGGSYNSQTKKVVLTLQNGNNIEFSVADLVSGLQTELSASNKLNPAYINYDSTHRAVSDTEKSTWNGKQNAIDSSHKLSADLVDDTSSTNKFATAAELEQIETNKNNISLLGGGGRNVFKYTNLSGSNNEVSYVTNSDGSITVTVASTVAANRELALTSEIENTYDGMKLSGSPAIATGDVEYLITGLKSDGSYQNEQFSYNSAVTTINRGTPKIKFSIYVKSGTVAGTYVFYPMIQTSDNQAAFSAYTPYIPTLADIAEMLNQ